MFRRSFQVSEPSKAALLVEVSADSRYILFCNGTIVARGPAKGDVHHHFFDQVDLCPFLVAGENVLAALVLDMSRVAHRPEHLGAPCSVMTYAGGFILGGELTEADAPPQSLSTGPSWRVHQDTAHRFQNKNTRFEGYLGYFEHRISSHEPAGWKQAGFDDSAWPSATPLYPAELLEDRRDPASPYGLMPRIIPMLPEEAPTHFVDVFAPGGHAVPEGVASIISEPPGDRCVVPANSEVTYIFDAGEMTTGFPIVQSLGGRGSKVELIYAEALRLPWDTPDATLLGEQQPLGNLASHFADESTGWTFDRRGSITGWCDIWEPAGTGDKETFSPLHWRAYRYLGLRISTGDDALVIRAITHSFCAYPYQVEASFDCSAPDLNKLWDISVRTMRLCTHETFEDCVHYEQMQYAGDTMITSKLGMLVSGDYSISKQALLHFDWSRIPDGLTQSRYPSRLLQVIPSWSLHWITNIKDYLLCSGDRDTVRELLPGVRAVIDWFRRHTNGDGLPEKLPYWNTADWCPWWKRGQPPGWDTGPTCVIASQYTIALTEAAWLHDQFLESDRSTRMRTEAENLRPALHATFWSDQDGLYFDRPGGPELSQYGNAWAIMAAAPDAVTKRRILDRFPHDPALAPVSFFGWHAIFTAMDLCGDYDRMPTFLGPWREMIENGLSTWAEENSYWRSLCHAWTAHPALDFITRVLGVRPTAPGFSEAIVEPHPCGMEFANGRVCTPHGTITVSWKKDGDSIKLDVDAPDPIMIETKLSGSHADK